MSPGLLDELLKQQPFAVVLLVIAVIALWRENRRRQKTIEGILRSMKEYLDVSRNTGRGGDRASNNDRD